MKETLWTLAEFARAAQDAVKVTGMPCNDDTWAGGSFETAIRLVETGWSEGVRDAGEIVRRIADRIIQATGLEESTRPVWDVTGFNYDVGEYLMGVPECWYRVDTDYRRRLVKITANITVSSGVPESSFRKRGIAIGALVMALTSRGFPVTVDAFMNVDNGADRVRLHDGASGSQMDLDRMIYGLAHPTVFRRLHHAIRKGGVEKWSCRWCPSSVHETAGQEGADLFIGGAHLRSVDRWQDGGEAWVLSEYMKQTKGGE